MQVTGPDYAAIERCLRQGELDTAAELLATALHANPGDPRLLFLRAVELERRGQAGAAIDYYRRSLQLNPRSPQAHNNVGFLLLEAGDTDNARAHLEQAVALGPGYLLALRNLIDCMGRQGEQDVALARLGACTQTTPIRQLAARFAAQWRKFDLALDNYKLLVQDPACSDEDIHNLVECAIETIRYREIIPLVVAQIRTRRDRPLPAFAYSRLLAVTGELDTAEAWHQRAVELDPEQVGAAIAKTATYKAQFPDSVALPYGPAALFIRACQLRWQVADWENYERDYRKIADTCYERSIAGRVSGMWPSFSVFFPDYRPDFELHNNRIYGDWVERGVAALRRRLDFDYHPASQRHRQSDDRLVIGLVSPDLCNNAVSHTLTGLMQHLDRRRFRVVGFATRPPADDYWGRLATERLDLLVDISAVDNATAARRIHEEGVDILCDTYGWGGHQRPEIFALRPAPLQILLTGFPGSLGVPWIDYIFATRNLIDDTLRPGFREHVVTLPVSRHVVEGFPVANMLPDRRDLGLPAEALVLACLHRTEKISPDLFDCWLEALVRNTDACLWLLRLDSRAERNLRATAAARGVNPDRLHFSPFVSVQEHIARLRQADLYLDTFIFGGFNSSAMALYAGVPVLTVKGSSFSTRMAADACLACGLPETVVFTRQQYGERLLQLAVDRERLARLRARLANPSALDFFNPLVTAGHMAKAFQEMHRRYRAGEAPADFSIER